MSKNEELGLPRAKMEPILIAFDVDGTLRCNCKDDCELPNKNIVELFKILSSFKNTRMIVWSGGGKDYAYRFARKYELGVKESQCFSKIGCNLKPQIAVDDIQDTALGQINLIVREK